MIATRALLTCLLLTAPAFCQQFKNVDVHAAQPGARDQAIGRFRPGARFEWAGVTLHELIVKAYSVADPDWVIGGPDWLGSDRFDIVAEIASDVTAKSQPAMLQALLADRFHLQVHADRRSMPVYVLLAGKRPLPESPGGDGVCKVNGGRETSLTCGGVTMAQFASDLRDQAYGYFDRPLFDKTGLSGRYDLTLRWTPFNRLDSRLPGAPAAPVMAFDAVEKQLGLKVGVQEEMVPVTVIDHIERVPTPDAPGVAEALRAASLIEFEVAELRVHKPGSPFKFATYDSEVNILGLSLRNLIGEAYGVRDEELASEAKWIDTTTFDVIAKAPRKVPWENQQMMLQTLFEDRLQLKYHREDRPITAYVLTVGKRTPQLAASKPGTRSACRKSLSAGGLRLSCRNTTMEQLAAKARELIGDRLPVADGSALEGGYDFALTWTPGRNTASENAPDVASLPTGEVTFGEALEKQLGLRLRKQKHPMPVMVIDHVELPKEN